MMDVETMKQKIKDIQIEIRHTTNAGYKEVLERRLEAYINLLPKARVTYKLEKGDYRNLNGANRQDALMAAWQEKFKKAHKEVTLHDYFGY